MICRVLLLARFKFPCHGLTSNSGQSGIGDAQSVSSPTHDTVVVKECRVRPVHRDCILVADLILTPIHWEAEGWIHVKGEAGRLDRQLLQIRFIFLARFPSEASTLAQASLPPSSSTYSMSYSSHVTTSSSRYYFSNKFQLLTLFLTVLAGHFGSL